MLLNCFALWYLLLLPKLCLVYPKLAANGCWVKHDDHITGSCNAHTRIKLPVHNGNNEGWPSARLFGWSAADWSRPATNKSISSERRKKSIVLLRKEITNKLVVDRSTTCCSKKGWAAEKSSKKGVINRKEKCFLSSQTRWSWQNKKACTSFWTCSSSPGHWPNTQEPSSSHAAASTFKVCARKRNLLILRTTCLDRSRWRYHGTLIGIRSFL